MRKKRIKKGTRGWFVKMNAGNPEVNADAFNHMMDTDGPTSGTTADGATGSVAVAESKEVKKEDTFKYDDEAPKLFEY